MGKIIAYIMRENKSVKRKKIPQGDTQFKYGSGKYYLQSRGCFLKGKKIYTFYFENIPYPISFDSFKKISTDPKDKKELKAELQIDSSVIKDMTEKDLLNSLTETTMENTEILVLVLLIVAIGVGVGAIFYIHMIAQALGL